MSELFIAPSWAPTTTMGMPRVRLPTLALLAVLVLGVVITPIWLGLIGWVLVEAVLWIVG